MAGKEKIRIEIGFEGGQAIALKLPADEYDGLAKALEGGGWHSVATAEGDIKIDLSKVVYVRRESPESHVGF